MINKPSNREWPGRPCASGTPSPSRGSAGGFSLVEVLVVVALIGSLVTVAGSFVGVGVRRGQLVGPARELRSLLWEARVAAIQSGHPVVVQFDASAREITVFRDHSRNLVIPHSPTIAANDGNGVQDTYTNSADDEPTLRIYRLREGLVFRRPGGTVADADSVAFDGTVAEPLAPPVDDRIIFLSTGRALSPTSVNSRRPVALTGGVFDCASSRGVYITDRIARDFFRISVDDVGIGGKVSLLKYLGPTAGSSSEGYAPSPWSWSR